jgi:hypothetical protein
MAVYFGDGLRDVRADHLRHIGIPHGSERKGPRWKSIPSRIHGHDMWNCIHADSHWPAKIPRVNFSIVHNNHANVGNVF